MLDEAAFHTERCYVFFYKLDKIYIFFLGWEHILFKQRCSMAPKE